MKVCKRCSLEKPESDFSPRQTQCKACRSEVRRERYQQNIEQELQWRRDGHKLRREKDNAYAIEYAKNNPEKVKARQAAWRANNREKYNALSNLSKRRSCINMDNYYIRKLIATSRGVSMKDVPKNDPEIYSYRQRLIDKRIRRKVKDPAPALSSQQPDAAGRAL